MDTSNENSISLNKFISNTGRCSRREADKLIEQGRVRINQEVATKGNRVFPNDQVFIDEQPLEENPAPIYIALNKPMGIVCTTDLKEPQNIIEYINHKERLFPIGRLDKGSQGLIFLTNDGDIVNKILRAGNLHEKEYLVTIEAPVTPEFIKQMSNGIPILGTVTKKCKVEAMDKFTFKIILTQGLNRQIRRMCEYLGTRVRRLERTRIMNVELGDLRRGAWRNLTEREITEINQMVAKSSKTEEASRGEHGGKGVKRTRE